MYMSFHSLRVEDHTLLLVHMMSSLSADFAQRVQDVIDNHLDPYSDDYDPGFPWDTVDIHVLYHGLGELPDRMELPLPDGRVMKVHNINPGHNNPVAKIMEAYVQTMEVGRQALLRGLCPMEAARFVWEYCRREDTITFYNPYDLLTEMYQMREAMAEDLKADSIPGGEWVC